MHEWTEAKTTREELEKELYKKYPWAAPVPLEDGQGTTMMFGFECGDGWYGLIEQLCESTQNQLDRHRDEEWTKEFCLMQAKEKFGALQFYVSPRLSIPEIENLIRLASDRSEHTCELCGREGKMREVDDWLSVRCDRCWAEEQRHRKGSRKNDGPSGGV